MTLLNFINDTPSEAILDYKLACITRNCSITEIWNNVLPSTRQPVMDSIWSVRNMVDNEMMKNFKN